MKYIVKKDYYCPYCEVEFNCDHPNVQYYPRCSTSDLLYKGFVYEKESEEELNCVNKRN